jgi:hypothetical protein
MRRTLLFSLSMAAALCCGLAAKPVESAAEQPSQPPALQEPAHVSPRLNLSLEQRHTIKEIVKDLKLGVSSAETQPKIGDPAPSNIDLQPMPAEIGQKVPQIKSHMFFLTADQFVIVDPKDKKVADVIKLNES